jgi:hypothetical protein
MDCVKVSTITVNPPLINLAESKLDGSSLSTERGAQFLTSVPVISCDNGIIHSRNTFIFLRGDVSGYQGSLSMLPYTNGTRVDEIAKTKAWRSSNDVTDLRDYRNYYPNSIVAAPVLPSHLSTQLSIATATLHSNGHPGPQSSSSSSSTASRAIQPTRTVPVASSILFTSVNHQASIRRTAQINQIHFTGTLSLLTCYMRTSFA